MMSDPSVDLRVVWRAKRSPERPGRAPLAEEATPYLATRTGSYAITHEQAALYVAAGVVEDVEVEGS